MIIQKLSRIDRNITKWEAKSTYSLLKINHGTPKKKKKKKNMNQATNLMNEDNNPYPLDTKVKRKVPWTIQ